MPYLIEHFRELANRHYIRWARTWNYWFDFSQSVVRVHEARFGDDFCLVITHSELIDDAYVLPWPVAQRLFAAEALDHRGRWYGKVIDGVLSLPRNGLRFPIHPFHNAFELLTLFGSPFSTKRAA